MSATISKESINAGLAIVKGNQDHFISQVAKLEIAIETAKANISACRGGIEVYENQLKQLNAIEKGLTKKEIVKEIAKKEAPKK